MVSFVEALHHVRARRQDAVKNRCANYYLLSLPVEGCNGKETEVTDLHGDNKQHPPLQENSTPQARKQIGPW